MLPAATMFDSTLTLLAATSPVKFMLLPLMLPTTVKLVKLPTAVMFDCVELSSTGMFDVPLPVTSPPSVINWFFVSSKTCSEPLSIFVYSLPSWKLIASSPRATFASEGTAFATPDLFSKILLLICFQFPLKLVSTINCLVAVDHFLPVSPRVVPVISYPHQPYICSVNCARPKCLRDCYIC